MTLSKILDGRLGSRGKLRNGDRFIWSRYLDIVTARSRTRHTTDKLFDPATCFINGHGCSFAFLDSNVLVTKRGRGEKPG